MIDGATNAGAIIDRPRTANGRPYDLFPNSSVIASRRAAGVDALPTLAMIATPLGLLGIVLSSVIARA